jgi:hypothetical protein
MTQPMGGSQGDIYAIAATVKELNAIYQVGHTLLAGVGGVIVSCPGGEEMSGLQGSLHLRHRSNGQGALRHLRWPT